jgi:hypothetical protein
MNQRQRKYRLNKSRRGDSRPPWMKLKHVSPKIILDGSIGHIEGITFVNDVPTNDSEIVKAMDYLNKQMAEAIGLPAFYFKEPEL